MKTKEGRQVFIDSIRPGFFHFRCEGLELVVQMLNKGEVLIHPFSQKDSSYSEGPRFKDWREAERTIFDLFDQTRKQQQREKSKR